MDLLFYCGRGSTIPVDLSANCDGWIYDPNGSGIQILWIRSRDPFSGSTDMSGWGVVCLSCVGIWMESCGVVWMNGVVMDLS